MSQKRKLLNRNINKAITVWNRSLYYLQSCEQYVQTLRQILLGSLKVCTKLEVQSLSLDSWRTSLKVGSKFPKLVILL